MQHSHGPAPIQQHHLLFSRRRNGANCTRAPLPYARSVSVCLSVNPRCHGRHHAGNWSECDQNGLVCPTRIAEITMRCQVGQVNNIEFFCPAHQILVLRRGPSGHYQLRPPWMGTAPVVGRKRHYSIMAHAWPKTWSLHCFMPDSEYHTPTSKTESDHHHMFRGSSINIYKP